MRMQTARPGALSMARVAAAASCIMLTGCTTWVKPGANAAMLDAAETHCTAVSYATLPANIQTTSSTGGPTYGELKKCEKNSNGGECRKINGALHGRAEGHIGHEFPRSRRRLSRLHDE